MYTKPKARLYCCSIEISFGDARNKSLSLLIFLHVDARVRSLSPPWSGSEYLPLDSLRGEYKGSPGYMPLPHWVNTAVCDKGFIEKGVMAELGSGEEKKKINKKEIICISALSRSQLEYKAPVGRCKDSSHRNTTSLKTGEQDLKSEGGKSSSCVWKKTPISRALWRGVNCENFGA